MGSYFGLIVVAVIHVCALCREILELHQMDGSVILCFEQIIKTITRLSPAEVSTIHTSLDVVMQILGWIKPRPTARVVFSPCSSQDNWSDKHYSFCYKLICIAVKVLEIIMSAGSKGSPNHVQKLLSDLCAIDENDAQEVQMSVIQNSNRVKT